MKPAGKSERIILAELKLHAGKLAMRLFRNTVGMFYTMGGIKTRCGLGKDTGDLVGWTQIEITPEMVGRKIAVYTEIEAKKEGWKKPRNAHEKEQEARINAVKKFGGISGFATSKKDLEDIKKEFLNAMC